MEENSMMIILHSGNASQLIFQSLRSIKTKEFDKARLQLSKAKQESLKAHEIQTSLLSKMATGEEVKIDILLIHAQDHLMNSVLMLDLVEELIEVFEAYK